MAVKVVVVAATGAVVGLIEQHIFGGIVDALIQSLVVEPLDQALATPTPSTRGAEEAVLTGIKLLFTSFLPWWAAGTVTILGAVKKLAPSLLHL